MSAEIILQQSANQAALVAKREELAAVRAELAERSAELHGLRSALKAFEDKYFREAGVLYVELDELEASIAENEVRLYDSDAARSRAAEARERADESRAAACDNAPEAEAPDASPGLKMLFREVAKCIHPDLARDGAEAEYLTLLMARANQAYRRCDSDTLQQILDDHRELREGAAEEGLAVDTARIGRQIQHVRRDLLALEAERYTLFSSEIAGLQRDTAAAAMAGRDLLAELSCSLREQIAGAQYRLAFVEKQMFAHGR